MPKLSINTTLNYSPNFEVKKRRPKQIKFIIFHYTGMKKENQAISQLTNLKSKVSTHYLIKNSGEILTLVPDLYIAWHAGISSWKKFKSINKYSIGIEISNPGHEHNYKKFSKKQIKSILKLCSYLIKKYKIKSNFILGHSDIAPDRKKDPGEKFPWKYLSKYKVGYWNKLKKEKLLKKRKKNVNKFGKNKFITNLYKIGYPKKIQFNKNKYLECLTTAFQRRFRQELVNGIIDQECLIISENLLKICNKLS
tara:strand:- start:109 stop:864 length:756 start_codon:yes stop_codon:yes gene_type:complete